MTRRKKRRAPREPAAPQVIVTGPVVALLRVSTDEQDVRSQRGVIEAFAARERLEAVEFVSEPDGTKGRSLIRPALEGILTAARDGRLTTLLVSEVSRIGRLTGRTILVMDELHRLGVRVVMIAQGIDYSTEGGRLVARLLAAIAEMEAERLVARTRAGMNAAKAHGTSSGNPVGRPSCLFGEQEAAVIRPLRAAGRTWQEIADAGIELVRTSGTRKLASAWALRTHYEKWEKSQRGLDLAPDGT